MTAPPTIRELAQAVLDPMVSDRTARIRSQQAGTDLARALKRIADIADAAAADHSDDTYTDAVLAIIEVLDGR